MKDASMKGVTKVMLRDVARVVIKRPAFRDVVTRNVVSDATRTRKKRET